MQEPTLPLDLLQKWRIFLGPASDPDGETQLSGTSVTLKVSKKQKGDPEENIENGEGPNWKGIDETLEKLYGDAERTAGLQKSSPTVHAWLGDIRAFFEEENVVFLQKEAFHRLGLDQMLLQPETLARVVPDVNLVATLLQLKHLMHPEAMESARAVVRKLVEQVQQQLKMPLLRSVQGSLSRQEKTNRPRHRELDIPLTIRANLKHYQPELGTIVPQNLFGFGRKGKTLQHIILLIDQSGSMAESVVYAGILSSILASVGNLDTRVVVFDTAVVDLSHLAQDPVELLFGTQLGGGTDIQKALQYAQEIIQHPTKTHLFLISDLFEGPDARFMLALTRQLLDAGVKIYVILALSDAGRPAYNQDIAQTLRNWDIPVFACTPNRFPEVLAMAMDGKEIVG